MRSHGQAAKAHLHGDDRLEAAVEQHKLAIWPAAVERLQGHACTQPSCGCALTAGLTMHIKTLMRKGTCRDLTCMETTGWKTPSMSTNSPSGPLL